MEHQPYSLTEPIVDKTKKTKAYIRACLLLFEKKRLTVQQAAYYQKAHGNCPDTIYNLHGCLDSD